MIFDTPQETLAYVGRLLFERRLADFAGGNISLRVGDEIFITPRFSGARQQWNVDPMTIVYGRIDNDEVLNHPNFSREGKAHLAVYRSFPEANAIIHSHSFHVMPFCAAEKPIPPVLEATEKFGVIQVLPFASAHSKELASNVIKGLEPQRERITKHAAALLLPRHGLFTVSKDIYLCLDAVERIDWNAWCILAQKLMPEA
jgi:L-fuculose-phosphate aldolase